jgi:hypothetical protein
MKIAIGIHSAGYIPDEVARHIIPLILHAAKNVEADFATIYLSKSKVAAARNQIVENALKIGATHWLSLDVDHVFRPDLVQRLVAASAPDVAAVSGLIHKRSYPFHQVAFRFAPGTDGHELVQISDTAKVVEVDACAMGCTLINLEAILKAGVPGPWFVDTARGRSDMNFFRSVRVAGLRLLIDAQAHVGHLLDPLAIWPENIDEARMVYGPPKDAE